MDWYSITFSKSDDPKQKIKHIFLKYFTTSGSQEGMGVFSREVERLNATTFYFTPGAATIAKLFGATACERPSSGDLTLLFGPDTCWDLFPAEDRGQRDSPAKKAGRKGKGQEVELEKLPTKVFGRFIDMR